MKTVAVNIIEYETVDGKPSSGLTVTWVGTPPIVAAIIRTMLGQPSVEQLIGPDQFAFAEQLATNLPTITNTP